MISWQLPLYFWKPVIFGEWDGLRFFLNPEGEAALGSV